MSNILIVDDDKLLSDALSRAIKRIGHNVDCRLNLNEGLAIANSGNYDVVYLDVKMPDGNGIENLSKFSKVPSNPEIIIITGYANSRGAELAINSGAWDYVKKPSSIKEMTLPLFRALQFRENKAKNKHPVALKVHGIIGSGSEIMACLDCVAQAASCDANLLITGETGTGKELFARAVHNNSTRSQKAFVVVDCTVLPENLVESLLFGHHKGAFTGADSSKTGLMKQADGGTIFLDEVGELAIDLQKRFLRVLQERHFRPIGGQNEIHSDFRLIAATNRDLDEMVEENTFRKDLIYRLRALTIKLPSLRFRQNDIRELLIYYLGSLCAKYNIATKGYSPEFYDALYSYDWPGNVREFIHTIESAIVSDRESPILFPYHLPVGIRVKKAQTLLDSENRIKNKSFEKSYGSDNLLTFREHRVNNIEVIEKEYLQNLILHTSNNIKKACKIADLSKSRLYGLLKKHDICRQADAKH